MVEDVLTDEALTALMEAREHDGWPAELAGIASAGRKLALSLEGSTWSVDATCNVMRLRDQRRVNVGA